jgi:hypothetical protein
MRPIHAILVFCLALLFVGSTNRCAIAAAYPAEVEKCCAGEQAPADSDHGKPCGESGCAPCATLGVNLAALTPLAVPAPVWTEECEIAEVIRRLAEAIVAVVAEPPPDPASIPAPPWLNVMKNSLPVRGPSLVA